MNTSGEADRFGGDLAGFCSAIADRYTIERELGRGGNAIVFLAQDLKHKRPVAVKILRPELALHVTAERFLLEIEIAAKLQHPHILPLFDSGTAAGRVFYVMPYVEGESLEAFLARQGPLPVDEAIRLVGEVADALSHAHSRGIVHRDIKPGNILLSGGHALVADFGVARALQAAGAATITNEGTVIGTPQYISPEQASAKGVVDPRSDQYALGCVLYEMLAGQPPFSGAPAAVIARHLAEPPPPLRVVRPSVTLALQEVVERALAKVPADRWSTVAEFGARLTTSATALPEPPKPKSRFKTAGVALALAALAAVVVWQIGVGGPTPLDANAVVVFPLLQTPTDVEMEGAGLQMALAIGNALEHTEPLRWIEGWTWLDPAERRDPTQLTARRARTIAQQRHARWYIEGTMSRHKDFVTVVLRLIDVTNDSIAGRANDAGPVVQAAQTVWRALNKLLPSLLAPDRAVDLSMLTDRDPGAVAIWLQGEREYRRSRFGAALDLYRRAVDQDSTLALAALKGAWAAHWEHHDADGLGLVTVALDNAALLPAKYVIAARGLRHYLVGEADSAMVLFEQALQLDPGWVETWMAIGEVHYHFVLGASDSDSTSRNYFEHALELDPSFAPALFHLSLIALHLGEDTRLTRLVDAFEHQDPDSSWVQQLAIARQCAINGPGRVDWQSRAAQDPSALVITGKNLSERAAHLACAERALTSVFDAPGASPNDRWGATLGLFGVLLAQGRTTEIRPLLDRAVSTGLPAAHGLYVVAAGLAPNVEEPAAATIAALGGDLHSMGPRRLWYHTIWSGYRGDTARLRAVSGALRGRAGESDPQAALADAAEGRLAALTGDTVEALSSLERATSKGTSADLDWGDWQPLAAERFLYAQLLFNRRRWADAIRVAAAFDHPIPVMYLPYIRGSLELRARAAEALGQGAQANAYRLRLRALDQRAAVGLRT